MAMITGAQLHRTYGQPTILDSLMAPTAGLGFWMRNISQELGAILACCGEYNTESEGFCLRQKSLCAALDDYAKSTVSKEVGAMLQAGTTPINALDVAKFAILLAACREGPFGGRRQSSSGSRPLGLQMADKLNLQMKEVIAESMRQHHIVAKDYVAMLCDEMVSNGAGSSGMQTVVAAKDSMPGLLGLAVCNHCPTIVGVPIRSSSTAELRGICIFWLPYSLQTNPLATNLLHSVTMALSQCDFGDTPRRTALGSVKVLTDAQLHDDIGEEPESKPHGISYGSFEEAVRIELPAMDVCKARLVAC